MNIREYREPAIRKLTPLTERMDRQYGINIDWLSERDHLLRVYEHYSSKRKIMISVLGEADAFKEPDYAKAVLISETVRLFLREIAPKRRKKSKR
jgi:hypothetical protein